MQNMQELIEKNNKTHTVKKEELNTLIAQAKVIFKENHKPETWFERSIFINWSCGIADCKYCYLSTMPKNDKNALRSPASICAEALVCKMMGWKVGYLTGGLRVESTSYLIDLIDRINEVLGEKVMMNFGPYHETEINKLESHISGMGSAIESFDEELHNYICPSKPLKALERTLQVLKEKGLKKIITIILGMGEKMSDVDIVIEKINQYEITTLQLCFLKPQKDTPFENVPAPNPDYMAYWIAKVRIACPKINIKVALVDNRIEDLSLYLNAGANCFSRFMIFKDFNKPNAQALLDEAKKANRELLGRWKKMPEIDLDKEMNKLDLDEEFKKVMKQKAEQYIKKLKKLEQKNQLHKLKI